MRGRALWIAALALAFVVGGCLEPAYAVTIWKDSQIRVTALPGEPTLEEAITGGDLGAGGGSIDVAEQGGGASVSPATTITLDETTGFALAAGGAGEAILSLSAIPDAAISDTLTIGPGGSVDDAALSAPPTADDFSDNTASDLAFAAAAPGQWSPLPGDVAVALDVLRTDLVQAFRADQSGQISALTEKTTPVAADHLLLEDSEASNAKRRVQVGTISPNYVTTLSAFEAAVTSAESSTVVVRGDLGADVEALIIGVADGDPATTATVLHDADPTHGSISAALVGEPLVIIDSSAGVTRGQHCIVAAVDAGANTITCDRALDGDMEGATYRVGAAVHLNPGNLVDQERLTIRCDKGGFRQNQDDSVSPPVLVHRDDTNIDHDSEVVAEGCGFTGSAGVADVFSIGILHTGIGVGKAGRSFFTEMAATQWNAGATTGNLSAHIHGDRFYVLDGPTNSVGDQVYMDGVFIDATLPFQIDSMLNRFSIYADMLGNSNTSVSTADASPGMLATADMDDVLIHANVVEGLNYFQFAEAELRFSGVIRNPGSNRLAPPGGAYFNLDSGSIDVRATVNHFLPVLHPAGVNLVNVDAGGANAVSIRASIEDPRCVFSQSGTPINVVDAAAGGAGIKTVNVDWTDGDDCEPIVDPVSVQAETELDADAVGRIQLNGTDVWEIAAGSLVQRKLFTESELQAGSCTNPGQHQYGVDTDGSPLCATDDDVPESGDFGAGAALEADGGLTGVDTDECIVAGNGTGGAVECSGVSATPTGDITVSGSINIGSGSGGTCLIGRDIGDSEDVACWLGTGANGWTCETDTNGVCNDGT